MTTQPDIPVDEIQAALAADGIHTTEAEVATVLRNLADVADLDVLLNWRGDFLNALLAVPGVDPDGYHRDRLNAAREGYEWS